MDAGWSAAPVILCLLAVLGGCQGAVDVGGSVADIDGNDVAEPIVVGVENDTSRDVVGPLREAVAWWDGAEHEHDAAWEADVVVRPEADDPDIVARFDTDVECDVDAPACAPNFESRSAAARHGGTMQFDIGEIPNRPGLVKSLKHELGHVRGVGHCEPPHWLMGCPGSAAHEDADFRTRPFPWRSETDLSVYLATDSPAVREDVRAVLDGYENSSETPSDLRIGLVDDPWQAHVVLRVERCRDCRPRSHRRFQGGQSYGTDAGLEFLYWAEISVTTPRGETERAVREALEYVLAPDGHPG